MLNACPTTIDFDVYQPRNPKASAYYRCVEDHFEQLEAVWDERYQRRFGFWRPYVTDVIHRYLDCGDLQFGFARVKCEDCGHEYLLAFSCKRQHFCPSCHQKRVVEFGEWLCTEVLKYVPHRQWVFSIPKRLRIYFMFDRKLLTKLSRCAWKVLNLYLTQAIPNDDAKAGAAVAVQSFGDFQNFHPHLHILATDGCFYNDDAFMVCPPPDTGELEMLFRYEVLKMLKAEGKITDVVIENMMNWRHSGFNVYCGNAIWPHNEEGLENLARYIIRASFSQERMTYIAAKDSSDRVVIDSDISPQAFRKNWARLIQKIYNVNPLLCAKCSGSMRIISLIDDAKIIKKILKHLDLWDVKRKPPPCANGPPPEAFIIYDQSSAPSADDYLIDADYPIETYL